MLRYVLIWLFLIMELFSAPKAEACRCISIPTFTQVFRDSSVSHIFAGKILRSTTASGTHDISQGFLITFSVIRAWRGVTTAEVTVFQGGTSCDVFFVDIQTRAFDSSAIFLFAGGSIGQGRLFTNLCLPLERTDAQNLPAVLRQYDIIASVLTQNPPMLRIFPNPTTEFVQITGIASQGTSRVRVYDPLGTIVLEKPNVTDAHTIDVRHLPHGVYFVEILNGTEKSIVKLLKH